MLPEMLQTTLLKKNVPFNVSSLCNLGPCIVVSEAPRNIAQEKTQAIQAMLLEHVVNLFTYVYIRSFT